MGHMGWDGQQAACGRRQRSRARGASMGRCGYRLQVGGVGTPDGRRWEGQEEGQVQGQGEELEQPQRLSP